MKTRQEILDSKSCKALKALLPSNFDANKDLKFLDLKEIGTLIPNYPKKNGVTAAYSVIITPARAAQLILQALQFTAITDKPANRVITDARATGPIKVLTNLMTEDKFVPAYAFYVVHRV